MRSRTEMVTTTFVDSEEDYSDDDDSEEDWRPSASSKNGKKQKCSGGDSVKRGRKRKSSLGQSKKKLKRKVAYEVSGENEGDDPSDNDCNSDDFETGSQSKKCTNLAPKKQFYDKNSSTSFNDGTGDTLNLLVYIKDLKNKDFNKNNSLCLWRKDNNNLLQKYIRVKTSPEQFLFTPSSVYSSFDDKRISDFYDIKVISIDSSNRRVRIANSSDLQKIYLNISKNKNSDDDILIEKKSDIEENESPNKTYKPVLKHHEEEDDDEEEVEEENDEEEDDYDLRDDDDDAEDDDSDD